MSQNAHQQLDDTREAILNLRDVADTVFDELHTKISKLLVLVEIQKNLNEMAQTIREGQTLPVQRINHNIKRLAEDDRIRWSKMWKLNSPAIIFSTIAFNKLLSLPNKQYDCLVENVQDYVEAQGLPCEWIACEQIRKVVAKTPRRESTHPFLESYRGLETQHRQDNSSNVKEVPARKRQRTEDEHPLPTNQELDKGEMQTRGLRTEDNAIRNMSGAHKIRRPWEARPNPIAFPAISTNCTNTPSSNETQCGHPGNFEIVLTNPNFTPRQGHEMLADPLLQGIVEAFDVYVPGDIRQDMVRSGKTAYMKVGITMDFPRRD